MLKHQIHLLNGMQQHRRQTHPPLTRQLLLFTAIVINPISQPSLPDIRAKTSMIVPSRAKEIMLSLVAKHRGPRAAGRAVAAVIEDRGEVGRGPRAVDVDGVRGVDGFVAMVQGAAAGPHFGEHGVALEGCFAMHGFEQAAGEARGGDDGCAARREALGGIVACDVC